MTIAFAALLGLFAFLTLMGPHTDSLSTRRQNAPSTDETRSAQLRKQGAGQPVDGPASCAPFGGHKSFRLNDDTAVELNSGTCITAEITAKRRLVRLESGEAIFQVARDPSRPFVVETGPISIEALGTQFDVYRREVGTRVAVAEGAVQVSSRGTTLLTNVKPLSVLQQIDVPDDTTQAWVRRYITSRDFERMTAWVNGEILFENQTLKEALGEFARYQHIQVDFRDPDIAEVRFGGVFHTVDVDTLLRLLKFRCIHSEYDRTAQRITLSSEHGKRAGTGCK